MYREHFFAHQEDDKSKCAKTDNLNRYLAIRKLLNNLENFNNSRSPESKFEIPAHKYANLTEILGKQDTEDEIDRMRREKVTKRLNDIGPVLTLSTDKSRIEKKKNNLIENGMQVQESYGVD